MRRVLGAAVVMAVIGAWNLTGRWLVRRGPGPDPPSVVVRADSVPATAPSAPAVLPAPATRSVPRSLPASFRTDPLAFLSSASADSLDLLPGVGPVLAARIIETRVARGPFTSWDDVLAVKGIGPRTVARWRSSDAGQ